MKTLRVFGKHQIVAHPEKVEQFLRELLKNPPKTGKELERRKFDFSAREDVPTIAGRDMIAVARSKGITLPAALNVLLQKRAVRTISGVSPIGILTKPYPCPGRCVYCPTEDRMPKSYMKNQPAAARALRNKFHPYAQVKNRILALEESGHPTSKLEVIVMGGTWSFLPKKYQSWYVRRCFDAANGDVSHSLSQAQTTNETAARRIIGLTLETRPDFISEKELIRMRRLGCTRVEIGVQTLDDGVQRLTKRGHTRSHVIAATKLLKDFGFKICYHLMPGLPGSTPEKDLLWMQEVFENPDFCPDFIKIYPCVVLETAELKSWWEAGTYQPYRDEDIIRLLVRFAHLVPPWVRIMRLMRDIPVSNILDGAKFSNLRQILKAQPEKLREIVGDDFYREQGLDKTGWNPRDIREREVGFATENLPESPLVLLRRDYAASGGTETFLSFESEDGKHLYALLRLRKPSPAGVQAFGSVLRNAGLIREVHSYGAEVGVGEGVGQGQHRGLGRKLIEEAERITRDEWNLPKITIIAGVGTREYYRKHGYELRSTYMTKKLV